MTILQNLLWFFFYVGIGICVIGCIFTTYDSVVNLKKFINLIKK